jgi:hypothetical protein
LPRMFGGVVGASLRKHAGCNAASSTQERGHRNGMSEDVPRSLRIFEK